ncbi:MAG: hypothetical protein B6D58_02830 [candidate division Zixibacteria bacterium 4484_95]|nr:MAG: hypothetical protein B6D58_02830 [candidate division Zixibacteria bacterium 4484_95]
MFGKIQDILGVEDLIGLHKKLVGKEKTFIEKWEVQNFKNLDSIPDIRGKFAIYLLVRSDYPVYLGKSVNASIRVKNHVQEKDFDRMTIFSSEAFTNDIKVLSYIEFLCYYTLWSKGYCLIYNSTDVWNTLPIKSQKGPAFNPTEVSYAHNFMNMYLSSLEKANLSPPMIPGKPLKLEYHGKKEITVNAIYWRPTIKKELHSLAIDYWDKKNEERLKRSRSKNKNKLRCKFTGSGSFQLLRGTKGIIMRNDYDQQTTYDLLRKIEVFTETSGETLWVADYPFPKSNLMLHIIQAMNSANARYELSIASTGKYLHELENEWRYQLGLE